MRTVRNIVFINVVIVILLHALIPHKHHGEMSFAEHQLTHQNAHGLFKVIGLAFQEGSSNVLDNYVLAERTQLKKTDVHYTSPFTYPTLEALQWPVDIAPKVKVIYYVNPTKTLYIQSHGLRGPPCHDFYA